MHVGALVWTATALSRSLRREVLLNLFRKLFSRRILDGGMSIVKSVREPSLLLLNDNWGRVCWLKIRLSNYYRCAVLLKEAGDLIRLFLTLLSLVGSRSRIFMGAFHFVNN